jgi:hypothetical protein
MTLKTIHQALQKQAIKVPNIWVYRVSAKTTLNRALVKKMQAFESLWALNYNSTILNK